MARADRNNDFDDDDDVGLDASLDDTGFGDTPEPFSAREEASAETRSVSSRCRIREQLNHDVEDFLAHGGCISQIDPRAVRPVPGRSGGDIGSSLF